MKRAGSYLLLAVLILILNAGISFSQVPGDAVDFTFGIGKVVRNHPDFPDINAPGYDASLKFSRHYRGSRPWHRYYNFPRMGIRINGGSLGNKAVLGHYAGVMPEMTFEKRIGNSWFWGPGLSLGAVWFSHPYHEDENPQNVAVGSAFTFFAGADVMLGRKISARWDLVGKVGILHASNSHFKLPNVGLNMPLVSIGVRYKRAGKQDPEFPEQDTLITPPTIRLHARIALGINEFGSSTTPVNGPKYPVYLATVYVSKMYSPVNKVTAGIEAWYNKGVYDFIVSQEFYDENRHEKSCAVAIVLGHEFLMGHFGLITTGGIYIYNPFYKDRLEQNEIDGFKDKLKSYIPARLGVQYYFKNTNYREKNNLFVGIYIKTNFGQADFLESGLGYMF